MNAFLRRVMEARLAEQMAEASKPMVAELCANCQRPMKPGFSGACFNCRKRAYWREAQKKRRNSEEAHG